MKKRLSILLLSLLLLCSLAACNKKDKYGVTYTEDGVLQNTLIQCVITKAEVDQVNYQIHNATDYEIYTDAQWTLLQAYEDGAWVQTPYNQNHLWVDRDNLGAPRRTNKPLYEDGFSCENMKPGFYRIVVKLEVQKPEEGAPVEEVYAVAYFTITDEVYGVFEEKDGILQNTKVTLSINDKELTAPVMRIRALFENKTAFKIERPEKYAADENYDYLLEVFADGVWKKAPSFGEILREDGGWSLDLYQELEPGDDSWTLGFWKRSQIEGGNPALMDKRYIALEPGEYRVRVKYAITEEIEGAEIPEGQLEAVAYFTVVEPKE